MQRDIKTRREGLALSQRALAAQAGISNSQLSRIEAGRSGSPHLRQQVADKLTSLERAAGILPDDEQPPQVTAARAAYRLGLLEAMLHPDTIEALEPPGIIVEQMRGERTWRLLELAGVGLTPEDLDDLRLYDADSGEGSDLPKPRKPRKTRTRGRAGTEAVA